MITRTPKGIRMTAKSTSRRGAPTWLAAMAASSAAVVMLPTTAIAADPGASTVRATLDSAGGVKDIKVYGPDGAASAFTGKLPLTIAATRSVSGGSTVLSYRVENTMSQKQDVTYTDSAGKSYTSPVELQLPLVAQLGVTLPKSMKNVAAPGATISTDPDGTRHILWQMVLFTPLGAPSQDVSLTASGDGKPSVQLRATVVDPTTAAGLSGTAQAANAATQQDDFWHGYSNGGNEGLTKLRDGMGQLVAGLQLLAPGAKKLAAGLGAAGDGATKLAAGTDKAKDGAGQLSAGLGKLSAGQGSLTDGLTKIYAGQDSLTGGLTQIYAGLGALSNAEKGLPAAAAGVKQIEAGLAKLQAGVGDDATAGTLINGLNQVLAGITAIKNGLADPTKGVAAAVGCAAKVVGIVAKGSGALTGTVDPCFGGPTPPLPGVDPVSAAVLGKYAATLGTVYAGLTTQLIPGLAALEAGAGKLRVGLSHPATSAADPGGVKEGLALLAGGLAQVEAGLTKAADGSTALYVGTGKALAGSKQLTAGSGAALDGSKQLFAGTGSAFTGSQALLAGLGQLSDGQHKVADGLPAAVTGAAKIADGLAKVLTGGTSVKDGIGQVQDGAVAPLNKQLSEASQNARKQVAILSAAGALAAKAPGGAGASYVLDQSFNPKLAASSTTTSDGNTGRNVGLGIGALMLLLFGTAGGFAAGRRRRIATP